ncbi:MAG TPA: acyltransferase [Candidatus Binataceae bacterium]|jgi:peptidoglycan/LPS O-acetylase OafA/YrhL|nr:acyltransferase [Candidatus Binataceae bacterium]
MPALRKRLLDRLHSRNNLLEVSLRQTIAGAHLDFLRGIAAVAVVLGHIRLHFFRESIGRTLWYPDFAHEAVIIFFVLSGYLIGRSILQAVARKNWSSRAYAASRLIRLWLVLLPALILTAAWDNLGLRFFGAASRSPNFGSDSAATFVGNLMFLKKVATPTFGNNYPLWSLAYEFWYYVAGPLLIFACAAESTLLAGWLGLSALVILAVTGRTITAYFGMWLLGLTICLWPRREVLALKAARHLVSIPFVLALVAGTICYRTSGSAKLDFVGDGLVAISCAALIYVLIHDPRPAAGGALYGTVAAAMASFSYTLYLTHNPLLNILSCAVARPRWPMDGAHLLMVPPIAALALTYGYLIYYVTERHTDRIRRVILTATGQEPHQKSPPARNITTATSIVQ